MLQKVCVAFVPEEARLSSLQETQHQNPFKKQMFHATRRTLTRKSLDEAAERFKFTGFLVVSDCEGVLGCLPFITGV